MKKLPPSKLFDSQWPIIEAVMNMASDKKLALAVSEAGGFPSLFTGPVHVSSSIDFDPMYFELDDFIRANGSANVVVPLSVSWLLEKNFLKIIKDFKISHWEILPREKGIHRCSSEVLMDNLIYHGIKFLQQHSCVMGRLFGPVKNHPRLDVLDAVTIKGSNSAGGGTGIYTVQETFDQQINYSKNVIPYGGIGTPQQVKEYIQKGAPAVGIGTLFALCAESPLSHDVKLQMINKSSSDIVSIKGNADGTLQQNAILLDSTIVTDGSDNKGNHTNELVAGIHGNGTQGLIFAGHGLDFVTKIQTVRETIEYLTSEL
jgi:hypothetical protein